MKLALINNKGCKGFPEWNLVLENKEEIKTFLQKHNNTQAWEMWEYMGNRKVNHKESSGVARYLDAYLAQKNDKYIYFPELADAIDKLNSKKYLGMAKLIDAGHKIRAAKGGGYSNFSEKYYEIYQYVDINEEIFLKYLFDEKYTQFFSYLNSKNISILQINQSPAYFEIDITYKYNPKIYQIHNNLKEVAKKYFNINQKLNFSIK